MATILAPGRNLWRQHPVEELGLLVDGLDYYREFYRAALTARRTLVIAGWQFDSGVPLLRGKDAETAPAPITLLPFLNHLCESKPDLHIWILAWDFHLVFAAEREWMQQIIFDWTTNARLHFRFDSNHVEGGSHHQKFAVIDDDVSFIGGLDLCDHRWDDRKHTLPNALRMSRGEPHQPFHDIQMYLKSPALAATLHDLFAFRWQQTGGEIRDMLRATQSAPASTYRPDGLLPIAPCTVALSRTDPAAMPEGEQPCTEVLTLYRDAIAKAEQLIYVETQYFSSQAICDAFERRMRDDRKGKLELVFILNMRGETLKEQAAVGLAQAQNLGRLRVVAKQTGHALGLYYTLPICTAEEKPERGTYIHAKLMIVDDRFMTVGSANLTNRSMGVDTELNTTVESNDPASPLARSIREARLSLLAEHTGGERLEQVRGLVATLDAAAVPDGAACRLRPHPSPTEGEQTALSLIDPQTLPFDPATAEEYEHEQKSGFLDGLARQVKALLE